MAGVGVEMEAAGVAIGRLARFGHLRPAGRPVRARRARFRALSSFSVAV